MKGRSDCYNLGRTAKGHTREHRQQTLCPRDYPRVQRLPSTASYGCDVCTRDLSRLPRARCLDCKNYDLCLDCLLVGATSLKHRTLHNVNIVTSHLEPAPPLMGADMAPTDLFVKLIDAVFDYVDHTFTPRETGRLEAAKLSAFYSYMGVEEGLNIGRFSNEAIAKELSSMGCEFILVSDNTDEINARAMPWSLDGLDTMPRTPALTRNGVRPPHPLPGLHGADNGQWKRFFIFCTWRDPDLMHFLLSNALSTGQVMHKRKGEPYRLSLPREVFPRRGVHVEGRRAR